MKSFWNNSKIKWGFSLTICLALLTLTTCKKDKDEDDANFLLLGYLYSSGQANAAATKSWST